MIHIFPLGKRKGKKPPRLSYESEHSEGIKTKYNGMGEPCFKELHFNIQ
jgi:hypothetical protein